MKNKKLSNRYYESDIDLFVFPDKDSKLYKGLGKYFESREDARKHVRKVLKSMD